MMDLAGLLAAAVLLVTLLTLEFRRVGAGTRPETGQHAGPALQVRAWSSGRIVVGVMWLLFVLLLFPRVLGLLT
ncbi:MAG TPA: hypothetical protein VLJ40_09080 [Arthrobacter sp.]|jgi:hypothetical protein|nr:hypothetical protein [Arthrobacter sp.]